MKVLEMVRMAGASTLIVSVVVLSPAVLSMLPEMVALFITLEAALVATFTFAVKVG